MTHKEIFIAVISEYNRPLQFKELCNRVRFNYGNSTDKCLRQSLHLCVKAEVLIKVKIKGTASFYCKPEWAYRSRIKGKFNFNPYWNNQLNHESKSIQVQQSSDSLGGTTRLPIQQGEVNS